MREDNKLKIDKKIEEKYGVVKRFNFEWLYDFCELCERNNVSEEKLNLLMKYLLSDKNLEGMEKSNFLFDAKQEKAFFEYVCGLKKTDFATYLSNGLKYALENTNEDGNIIDSFIRYIVITNFQDVYINSTLPMLNENNTAEISCYMGGLEICHNRNIQIREDNQQQIEFEWFHARPNLRGIKLGSLLFKEFFKQVHDLFPDKDIVARNVQKSNTKAQRFYVKQGGEIFDVETEKIIKIEDVNCEEKGNVGVFFSRDKLVKLSDREIIPPQIDKKYELNKKKQDSERV